MLHFYKVPVDILEEVLRVHSAQSRKPNLISDSKHPVSTSSGYLQLLWSCINWDRRVCIQSHCTLKRLLLCCFSISCFCDKLFFVQSSWLFLVWFIYKFVRYNDWLLSQLFLHCSHASTSKILDQILVSSSWKSALCLHQLQVSLEDRMLITTIFRFHSLTLSLQNLLSNTHRHQIK